LEIEKIQEVKLQHKTTGLSQDKQHILKSENSLSPERNFIINENYFLNNNSHKMHERKKRKRCRPTTIRNPNA